MLDAIQHEIKERAIDFQPQEIETIYFGGGTPSVIDTEEIDRFIQLIHQSFNISLTPEITLEANPDDLNPKKIKDLKSCGVNRLSIGVQSFDDAHLTWMNRSHNRNQAIASIEESKAAGIHDLNVDLIFAIPGMDISSWERNIEQLISLNVTHWSCYNLTVEPKTALEHMVSKGKVKPIADELAAEQYHFLMGKATSAGFDHYEISNFSLPGHHARHNTNYWKGIPYLGVGPSAHSYTPYTRRWNIAHNAKYMSFIESNEPYFESEDLDIRTRFNEYVLTRLRTKWGCRRAEITAFGESYRDHFVQMIGPMIDREWVSHSDGVFTLTNEGKLFADYIASELFVTEL